MTSTLSLALFVTLGVLLCQGWAVSNTAVLGDDCAHQGSQHNFNFGTKNYYDRIIYTDNVSLKSKLMRVNTVDVTYPKKGSYSQGTIDYIEIQDVRKDGTGGCAYIQNGGVGQNSVTIHFKTQRNHGLDFKVNIYGR